MGLQKGRLMEVRGGDVEPPNWYGLSASLPEGQTEASWDKQLWDKGEGSMQ